ncbi:MAG: hypothetical protein CFE23_05315 [Flavobacterium sp. BFFFF1]|nr:MAG: hypothetical protein CFE23_05315 [Flavobacterium sp. BFFFF1]
MLGIAANAQITVNINKTEVAPVPAAKPTVVRYYYLPDYASYYDVTTRNYIYSSNGNWIYAKKMPARYKNYSFDKCRKVKIKNYRGSTPYVYYTKHAALYRPGKPVHAGRPAKFHTTGHHGRGKGHAKDHHRH